MKSRPWIWLIVANILFITGTVTLVVIAVRNSPQEVQTQDATMTP